MNNAIFTISTIHFTMSEQFAQPSEAPSAQPSEAPASDLKGERNSKLRAIPLDKTTGVVTASRPREPVVSSPSVSNGAPTDQVGKQTLFGLLIEQRKIGQALVENKQQHTALCSQWDELSDKLPEAGEDQCLTGETELMAEVGRTLVENEQQHAALYLQWDIIAAKIKVLKNGGKI